MEKPQTASRTARDVIIADSQSAFDEDYGHDDFHK
jgi:hypothetical protein